MAPYYFDYNATTPVAPEVLKAMEPYFINHYGNPSSSHQLGQVTARALKEARRRLASFLGAAEDSEIIFTSGGTESNNQALRSALAVSPGKKEIITSSVEHSSIRKLCKQLEKEGYSVREIGVDASGNLNQRELFDSLSEKTAIVSLMMANNETGVFFPVEEIGKKLKERGILFHVDAVQAVGKTPIKLKESGIDYLSLSAHKFYGPKGIGALYVRKGAPLTPCIAGGSQERGRRAGTENVPGIVGMGAACEMLSKIIIQENDRLRDLRAFFETQICRQISGVAVSGEFAERLPNTSHIRFKGIESETLLIALDQREMYASVGSACMSGSNEPSHVLKAMGFSDEECRSGVRFSFGKDTTQASLHILITEIKDIVHRLRSVNSNSGAEKLQPKESLV